MHAYQECSYTIFVKVQIEVMASKEISQGFRSPDVFEGLSHAVMARFVYSQTNEPDQLDLTLDKW